MQTCRSRVNGYAFNAITEEFREILFELTSLGASSYPAGTQGRDDLLNFFLADFWQGKWDKCCFTQVITRLFFRFDIIDNKKESASQRSMRLATLNISQHSTTGSLAKSRLHKIAIIFIELIDSIISNLVSSQIDEFYSSRERLVLEVMKKSLAN